VGTFGKLGIDPGNPFTNERYTPVTTFAGGNNWKQVATGNAHTVAIKTDGTLWTWGLNNGSIGLQGVNDTMFAIDTPVTTFAGGTNWKQVACGDAHTAAIKTDGTLWTWGGNFQGALGNNGSDSAFTPVTTFAGGTNWKQVAGGDAHIAAIKTDGTLWTWGINYDGQIGDNTTINKLTPVTTLAGGANWKQVAGGNLHTAAIKTDGTLWTWGGNGNGQLGVNDVTERPTPVITFAGGTNWKRVACGDAHTAAVTSGTDPTFFIA
jgi:alpha-tubulin suppressor-like RCC1 family protein